VNLTRRVSLFPASAFYFLDCHEFLSAWIFYILLTAFCLLHSAFF
jgi:hypothetical protein